jgi:peptidoglycan/LPS O-acetylase OafA/YrhL
VIWADLTASPRARPAMTIAPFGVALSLGLLLIGFRLEGALYLSPGGSWPYALMSLSTVGLVLSAALCEGSALRVIAPRPLRALGVISYGVFLYHQLALGLVGRWLGPESRSFASLAWNGALSLGLASLMGLASWLAVERPFLRWNPRNEPSMMQGERKGTTP